MTKKEKTYLLGMQQCFLYWDEYVRWKIVRHYYKSQDEYEWMASSHIKKINLISLIVNWFLDEITTCLILTSGIGARFKLQKPHVGGGIIRVCNNVAPQKKWPWVECLMLEMVTHHYKPQNK